ncbi:hypothetical protein MTR_5g048930 [Medicago truncatula]|uniref:Uncharacterized protein n=1 Tax=Medicago truncatula TaxID=3880 RepID=A0A072UES4_MEDTR|nr:hypothetical protein MTR_5g048930 [Medicago truncatula]
MNVRLEFRLSDLRSFLVATGTRSLKRTCGRLRELVSDQKACNVVCHCNSFA